MIVPLRKRRGDTMKKLGILLSVVGLWLLFLFNLRRGSEVGLGLSFILAVSDTMFWLNGQMARKRKVQSRNYQLLQRRFGPFTWLAVYGSLGITASLVILNWVVSTRWTARIMVAGILFYLLWGVVLCVLVASAKKDNRE